MQDYPSTSNVGLSSLGSHREVYRISLAIKIKPAFLGVFCGCNFQELIAQLRRGADCDSKYPRKYSCLRHYREDYPYLDSNPAIFGYLQLLAFRLVVSWEATRLVTTQFHDRLQHIRALRQDCVFQLRRVSDKRVERGYSLNWSVEIIEEFI